MWVPLFLRKTDPEGSLLPYEIGESATEKISFHIPDVNRNTFFNRKEKTKQWQN